MQTIRNAREAKGLTQEEVANHLHITRQTMAKYEEAPSTMSVSMALSVCSLLDCDFDEIFFSQDVNKTNVRKEDN